MIYMNKFYVLIIFLLILAEFIVVLFLQKSNVFDELIKTVSFQQTFDRFNSENETINYTENYKFIINHNIVQYSSYIVIEADTDDFQNRTYTIVFLIQLNSAILEYGPKEYFLCLMKPKNKNNFFEVEAFQFPKIASEVARKVVFKTYSLDNFDLNEIVVAVIWKPDFNKALDLEKFNKEFDETINKIVLPYDLIKYQIPTIIRTENPRIPSVGICVHYTHAMPSYILDWIDNNLSFGIRQIMFYDATDNNDLNKTIMNHYGNNNKLIIRPYDMTYDGLCGQNELFRQYRYFNLSEKVNKYLTDLCIIHFNSKYKIKSRKRDQHEQLTVNDCFTVFKQKYEFIAHFDLDEMIFPRSYKNLKWIKEDYNCYNSSKICSLKGLMNSLNHGKPNEKGGNHLYNYAMSLVNKVMKTDGLKLNELRSLYFQDSPYLIPNIDERNLVNEMGSFLRESKDNLSLFPYKLRLSAPPYKHGHTFIIEENDVPYVQYLYDSYTNFISCIYDNYLNKITKTDQNWIRYFYYTAESNERGSKVIHYYKNVNTIFIHRPFDYLNTSWKLYSSADNLQFLSHFRSTMYQLFNKNRSGSIRKLNIDFEYVFFLLQKYTSFCDNVSN